MGGLKVNTYSGVELGHGGGEGGADEEVVDGRHVLDDHGDGLLRERDVGVEQSNRRIVPVGDLSCV